MQMLYPVTYDAQPSDYIK